MYTVRFRLGSRLGLLVLLVLSTAAGAEVYQLASENDSVVGEIRRTWASSEDTLLDIARANGLGYHEIKRVNPTLDTWLPSTEKEVILPSRYVLPMAGREGIILNIPEMRLYYFPEKKTGDATTVVTYPLGIGRQGWQTPYINTRIIEKRNHPAWHPPESIRKEHEAMGDPLPRRVGPGPDNPLGDYAMRLGLPDYLIHGTNKPFGIGMRVSHGCIRLYPEDIEALFQQVQLRTPVQIINQPYKVGRLRDKIYLEAHPFLEEDAEAGHAALIDRHHGNCLALLTGWRIIARRRRARRGYRSFPDASFALTLRFLRARRGRVSSRPRRARGLRVRGVGCDSHGRGNPRRRARRGGVAACDSIHRAPHRRGGRSSACHPGGAGVRADADHAAT